MSDRFDVAVIGGAFGGSLVAMCLAEQGRSVVVLERARHPLFMIGESSTPLANLVLEDISKRYGLDELLPLCRYGTWKATYPELGVGPKRGFSFFAHRPGRIFAPMDDRANELLVAANAREEVADTQWLRADVDAFFAERARARGVEVREGVDVVEVKRDAGWRLEVRDEDGSETTLAADFVIDAAGGGSPLAAALGLEDAWATLETRSRTIFSHFEGVTPWESAYLDADGETGQHPFPSDDAALHHVLPEGWMWMLRFDHGVTSVGMLLTSPQGDMTPAEEWDTVVARYPSIAYQMRDAEQARPLTRSGLLQRRLRPGAGEDWAMLPAAAYYVDPLLSPGNAHTMYGVERIADLFEAWPDRDAMAVQLAEYDTRLQDEIAYFDRLVHGCYRSFRSFPLLTAFTMYYFAGAIFSEERRRGGTGGPWDGFLHSHDADFRRRVDAAYQDLLQIVSQDEVDPQVVDGFARRVAQDIEPWNTTGLADAAKRNMYPYE